MIVPSPIEMIIAGIAFPIKISTGCKGETNNWSQVPISLSRAMESAVTMSATSIVKMPQRLGTLNQV
jgi:hypothetical protein